MHRLKTKNDESKQFRLSLQIFLAMKPSFLDNRTWRGINSPSEAITACRSRSLITVQVLTLWAGK